MVVRRGPGTTYKSIRLSLIVVTVRRCNPYSTTIGPSRCAVFFSSLLSYHIYLLYLYLSAISALRACLRLNRSRFEIDPQPQCRFSASVWHCAHSIGLLSIRSQPLTAALYLFSRSGSVASNRAPQPTRQSEIDIAE